MAQFTGPSIAEVPGWRIGLIFLLFCIIAILYDYGAGALDRYLINRGKRALRHVVRRLQGELLVLGLLSLLLVAFEPYLLEICIGCSGDTCAWDCPPRPYEVEAPAGDATSGADGGPGRRRALLGPTPGWATGVRPGSGSGGRGLLAAGGDVACLQAAETCAPGSEPFWSQLAIVQAHLFLFTTAVVHILYACASMLLCLWKLRRWRRYEEEAREQPLRPLHSRFLPRPGDGALAHFVRCTASMLADSVDVAVYASLRRLFIERLDVHPSFNFHEFLTESMEEEFAGIVGVNGMLWCIMLLWIMLPPSSYHLIWLPALALAAGFVVAVKLQSIIICLAEDAYRLYGCGPVHSASNSALHSIKERLQRLSPFGGSTFSWQAKAAHDSDTLEASHPPHPASQQKRWQLAHLELQEQQQQQQTSPAGSGGRLHSNGTSALVGTACSGCKGGEEEVSGQKAGRTREAGEMGEAAGQGGMGGRQGCLQHEQQQAEQAQQTLGSELSSDLEAQQRPQRAFRAASAAAPAARPVSSVFRRCCPRLLSLPPWRRPRQRQSVSAAMARSQSFSERYQGLDAAGLFWLGRPRIVLRIIQGIYFENSLSVAAVLFSVWQGIQFDWLSFGGWPVLASLIAVQLLLLAFMSLAVLPVYALTTAAGSHSAASVIERALKKNIKPDVARALQRMSMNLPATPDDEGGDRGADHADPEHPPAAAPAAAAGAEQPAGAGAGGGGAAAAQRAPGLGRPALGRHSAPLPGLLQRLSPVFAIPARAGSPPLRGAASAASLHAVASGVGVPSFGALQAAPGGSASGAAGDYDAASLAAAAAAAAVGPPGWEGDDERRSITRLMGAMLQKQLQRQLERASSPAAARGLHSASGSPRGGTSGGGDQLGLRRASATAPPEQQEDHPGSVETCPPAVGAQLQQQLGAGRDDYAMLGTWAASSGGGSGDNSLAADGAGSSKAGQAGLVQSSSSSSARPTLAQVRGLFDAGAADEATQTGAKGLVRAPTFSFGFSTEPT